MSALSGSGLGRVETREQLKRVERSSLRPADGKVTLAPRPEFDFTNEHDSPPYTPHSSFSHNRGQERLCGDPRSAHRDFGAPTSRFTWIGFRVARAL
jgi:formylglycine-generating enzyme required for sulfatase activity